MPNTLIISGHGYRISLKSGSNHLQDHLLEKLRKHDSYDRLFNTKVIEVLEPESTVVSSNDSPVDLTGYNVDDAEVIIEEEWDTNNLNQWRSRDTRKGIFSAIDQRLDEIKAGNG